MIYAEMIRTLMKSQLTLTPHLFTPDQSVVEVRWHGKLVCTITSADGPGVKIISKHVPAAITDVAPSLPGLPGFIEISFPELKDH